MTVRLATYVDYGVDYLTCTFKPQASLTRLEFYLSRIEREEKAAGNITEKWAMQGYSGFHIGGLDWGLRDDGVIVRLSGPTAYDHWKRIGKLASNCSRIDLQTTVVYEEEPSVTILRHWKEFKAKWQSNQKYPEPKMWVGPQGAQAISSGSRHSQRFLRLYLRYWKDKRPELLKHVRYEQEVKAPLSKLYLTTLLNHRTPEEAIRAECQTSFTRRGCRLLWNGNARELNRSPKPKGNVERRLRWIADAIRPTVERLIAEGYEEETMSALGFSRGSAGAWQLRN